VASQNGQPAAAQTLNSQPLADWTAPQSILFMGESAEGYILFGVSSVPPDTCTVGNTWQFAFDPSTPIGKNMFVLMLTAKMTGKQVGFSYSRSTAPGTNETNGCSEWTVSVAGNMYIVN
jgi:hypothetical protein